MSLSLRTTSRSTPRGAGVVHRLERHAGAHRAVADHRDDAARSRPCRCAATAMPSAAEIDVDEWAVPKVSYSLSLRRGKPDGAAVLAQGAIAAPAAGEDLVRVGLVADVPDQPVVRRVEHVVQRDRRARRCRGSTTGGRRSARPTRAGTRAARARAAGSARGRAGAGRRGLSMRSSSGYISGFARRSSRRVPTSRRPRGPSGASAACAPATAAPRAPGLGAGEAQRRHDRSACRAAASLPAVLPSVAPPSPRRRACRRRPGTRGRPRRRRRRAPRGRPRQAGPAVGAEADGGADQRAGLPGGACSPDPAAQRGADRGEVDRLAAGHAARARGVGEFGTAQRRGRAGRRFAPSTPNASACSASPTSIAVASPKATWHVGLPRRSMSSSMQGRSSWISE